MIGILYDIPLIELNPVRKRNGATMVLGMPDSLCYCSVCKILIQENSRSKINRLLFDRLTKTYLLLHTVCKWYGTITQDTRI